MNRLWATFPYIYWLFTGLTFALINIETVTYSGFLQKYMLFDVRILIIPIVLTCIIFSLYSPFKKLFSHSVLFKMNAIVLFPITLLSTLFFTGMEYMHFPNYVFSTFHVHYDYLFYSFFLSLLIVLSSIPDSIIKKYKTLLVFMTPILLCFLTSIVRLWPNDTFYYLSREDHFFEIVQIVFYGSAAILSLLHAQREYRKKQWFVFLFYVAFFVFLFFITGEEISWGQRLFGLSSSTYLLENNMQKEISVHNMHGIHEKQYLIYLAFSFLATTSWFIIKIFPKKIYKTLAKLTPQWYFALYFIPMFMFYFCIDILSFGDNQWQEFIELLLAMGLFLSLLFHFIKQTLGNNRQ